MVEPLDGPVSDVDGAMQRLDAIAKVMDSLIAIPGTNFRVGADSVIGLVPVIGDLASQVVSAYLIWEARRLGASRWLIGRMIANSAVDTVFGAVPLVGDVFDMAFRANKRNMALLRGHLEKQRAKTVIDGEWRRH
jgi:hypothetical protein